jgi:hypothetical protein
MCRFAPSMLLTVSLLLPSQASNVTESYTESVWDDDSFGEADILEDDDDFTDDWVPLDPMEYKK